MRHSLMFASLAGLATPLAAQEVEEQGEEAAGNEILLIHNGPRDYIVVEGGVLGKPLSDRADPVRYIWEPDQGTGQRVENIVRDLPGWQQFRRSDARSANPTSQGLTARGMGGNAASRTLLILDGVPQSDPFGGWVNWTAFDSLYLKGMRIIDGGGRGADGPGALAGTIQISTRRGGSHASLAYGSRNSVDADAHLSLDAGEGDITVTGNYSRGDGFVPILAGKRGLADGPAAYQSYGMGARFVTHVGDIGRIEAAIRAFDDRRSRGLPFSDNRNSGADASFRVLKDIGGMSSMLLAYAQLREFASEFGAVSADRATVTPTLDQYAVPSTGLGARFEVRPIEGGFYNDRELRLGLDWRRTSGKTRENSNFVAGAPTRSRDAGGLTETIGGYAEWSADADRVNLAISGRVDHWSIRNGRRLETNIGGTVRSDDRFSDRSGWQWTGRAAVNWWFADPVRLKLSAYRGWRLPTLNELYRPFRLGADATAANEALAPETMVGGQVKLESNLDKAEIGLTFFYNRLDDAIANVTLGQGPGLFPSVGFVAEGGVYRQRQNLDSIRSKGVEFDASIDLSREIVLNLGYAFVDARVRGSVVALMLDGLRPAQVPKHAGRVGASWKVDGFHGDATLRYIGKQSEDDANIRSLGDALTADIGLGYDLSERLRIDLRGENIFNARVEAAISSTGIIERANPRTLWLGVRYNFD
ncbi:TonB-dependent receptor [Sphingorhabdus sp.]|uniref:TonB-dependent receptor n=2 Tax=Sphingorhabdus sp. TaxID=1902408 RepID=UPI003BB17B50